MSKPDSSLSKNPGIKGGLQLNRHLYAFTIMKTKNKGRCLDPLIEKLKWLEKKFKGTVTKFVVEYCKTGLPHLHGVLECAKQIVNLAHIKVRGWSNVLKGISNLEGWIDYCNKNQPTEKDLEELQEYINNDPDLSPRTDPRFYLKKLF